MSNSEYWRRFRLQEISVDPSEIFCGEYVHGARALLFRRFTDTNLYGTGYVKTVEKLAKKYPWM